MTKIKKNKEVNGNCITFGGTRNVAEEILNPHTKKRNMANYFDRKEIHSNKSNIIYRPKEMI